MMQSIGSLQKKYSTGAFELLSKTAPIQALLLLVFGPFIDYFISGNLVSNYMRTISYCAIVSSFKFEFSKVFYIQYQLLIQS